MKSNQIKQILVPEPGKIYQLLDGLGFSYPNSNLIGKYIAAGNYVMYLKQFDLGREYVYFNFLYQTEIMEIYLFKSDFRYFFMPISSEA